MEKNMTKEELKGILKDVRKAYRLLYLYQKRVMDTVNWIRHYLSFPDNSGYHHFTNNCQKKEIKIEGKWSWDWLNMYFYEFYFGEKTIENANIQFLILLQSDTGFFDMDLQHNQKKEIDKFGSTDASLSRLIFIVRKKGEEGNFKNWPWKKRPMDLLKEISKEEKEFIGGNEKEGLRIGKAYNIEEFINEESTKAQVDDFIEFCDDKKGVKIKVEES